MVKNCWTKRKALTALLLTVLLMVMAVGCSQPEQTKWDLSSDTQELMKQIAEVNSVSALREKYDRLEFLGTSYYLDGSSKEDSIYLDQTRYVYISGGNTMIDDSGEVYLLDGNGVRQICFIGGTYEEFAAENEGITFYSDTELVQDIRYEDDFLYVETIYTDESFLASGIAAGALEETVEAVYFEYAVDPETLEIYKMERYTLDGQGEKNLTLTQTRSRECEEYVMDAALTEALSSPEKRTITVIADPGTDQETTYEKEIPATLGFSIALPDAADGKVYSDAACETEAPYGDPGGDITYYARIHK